MRGRLTLKRVGFTLFNLITVLVLFISTAVGTSAVPRQGGREGVNAPAVPGQFVIKWRPGAAAEARRAAVQGENGRFFDRIADLDIDAVEFPALAGKANPRAAEAL